MTRFRVYLKKGDVGVAIRLRPRLDAQFSELIEQARMKRQGLADPFRWHVPAAVQQEIKKSEGPSVSDEALNAVLSIKSAQEPFPEPAPSVIHVDQYLEEWLERSKYLHGMLSMLTSWSR